MVYFDSAKRDHLDPHQQKDYHSLVQCDHICCEGVMGTTQVLNTKGAARQLGCSQTWIHKLVAAGKLKAHIYGDHGGLVERSNGQRRQGQGLYFLAQEIATYQPTVQRRPRGSKNKQKPAQEADTPLT